jgi:hypothetical protein
VVLVVLFLSLLVPVLEPRLDKVARSHSLRVLALRQLVGAFR